MKITIYTITECAFSKQEKEYLSGHGLTFEEKNLEVNREFLTEMLAVSGNFAGTPVTKIEKDDGQIVVLKGFTATEFDTALAIVPTAPAQTTPVVETPVAEVVPVVAEPIVAPQAEVPPAPTAPIADPAMANVLNTLEQQVAAVPTDTVAPPAPVVDPTAPVIPEPQF